MVRKYAFVALVAGSLFVKGARTIVVVRARLALCTFAFKVILAEQFWIGNCVPTAWRTKLTLAFATFAAP